MKILLDWFLEDSKQLEFLNFHHIVGLLVLPLMLICFFYFKEKILNSPKLEKIIRYSMIYAGILSLSVLRVYEYIINKYDIFRSMPFHFCSFALIFGIIALATKRTKVVKLTYFMGIIGGIFGLLFPGIVMGVGSYRFTEYFFSHSLIIFIPIYLMNTTDIRIEERKSVYEYVLFCVILTIPMIIWNEAFNTEYFFLNGNVPNGFDKLLPKWPSYYIVLMLFLFFVSYLFYYIQAKIYKKER